LQFRINYLSHRGYVKLFKSKRFAVNVNRRCSVDIQSAPARVAGAAGVLTGNGPRGYAVEKWRGLEGNPNPPFTVAGPVTCLTVIGNHATVGIEIKQATGAAEEFVGGGFFGYYLVYPQALTFLIHQGTEIQNVQAMITINEYVSLLLTIELGLGLVFELPILIFFLALLGIVDSRFLIKNFRYAVLIMFIIAAILTPTPDVMSMTTFALPMILLYVVGIGIAHLVHPKRRKARAAAG